MYKNKVNIFFVYPDKTKIQVECFVGDNVFRVARANNIKMKGSCGGKCACKSCFSYIEEDFFFKVDELQEVKDNEMDLLEDCEELEFNSRLCCQINITEDMNGMHIYLNERSYGVHSH